MLRFARAAKTLTAAVPRVSGVIAAAPAVSRAPARSFALFFNPPPHATNCKEVVEAQYENQRHSPLDYQTKTAMEYIAEVPIIEVDGETAICDGGDTFGGHPRVYLPLHKSNGQPETCKYCGLRYKMKKHHH